MPKGIFDRNNRLQVVKRNCLQCKQEFECKENDKQKFCGFECYWKNKKLQREIRKCLKCGKEIECKISSTQKYCSHSCQISYQFKNDKVYRDKRFKVFKNYNDNLTDKQLEIRVKNRKVKNDGNYFTEEGSENATFKNKEKRLKASKTIKKQRLGKTVEQIYGEEKGKNLRKQCSKRTIKLLSEGKFPQTDTLPHRLLRKSMQDSNIWDGFQDEYPFEWGSIDIANLKKKIAIYIDGNYWHDYPNGTKTDKSHNTYLKNRGWQVLRFWESDIKENVNNCLSKITTVLTNVL